MSEHTQLVERYVEGFRRSDHAMVLACLTEDVVWDLVGHQRLEGIAAFDQEIENPAFTGRPTLTIEALLEDGDVVVALGHGQGTLAADGSAFRFAFADTFTFRGDLVREVRSYVVPLG